MKEQNNKNRVKCAKQQLIKRTLNIYIYKKKKCKENCQAYNCQSKKKVLKYSSQLPWKSFLNYQNYRPPSKFFHTSPQPITWENVKSFNLFSYLICQYANLTACPTISTYFNETKENKWIRISFKERTDQPTIQHSTVGDVYPQSP